eukprot:4132317-Alexandrium_andersonii.AAC.1
MDQQPLQPTCGVPDIPLTKVSEEDKLEHNGEQTMLLRQSMASPICIPEDHKNIKYSMKKLTERLSRPKACVFRSINQLARHCWHFSDWVLGNGATKDMKDFTLDGYRDNEEAKDTEDYKPTSGIDAVMR